MNTPEWDATWAGARARADQHLAAIRDQEEAMRTFMAACTAYDDALRLAGVGHKQRVSAIVNLALGTGLTSEEG